MSDEAFKGETNKYDSRESINNLNDPNGYLRNFVFKNKRRKKGRPSWEREGGF